MIDIEKQIAHWRNTAQDDWRVANKLIAAKEILHGLFFVHLTLEKALKAHVCKSTGNYAPMIHDLLSLSRNAALTLTPEQEALFSEINTFNIRGRYSDMTVERPSMQQATSLLRRSEAAYKWLISLL
jgi:HEPN domain-containing protein